MANKLQFSMVSDSDCYTQDDHMSYTGTVAHTRTGVPCQAWTEQFPHQHVHDLVEEFPDGRLPDNFCRWVG